MHISVAAQDIAGWMMIAPSRKARLAWKYFFVRPEKNLIPQTCFFSQLSYDQKICTLSFYEYPVYYCRSNGLDTTDRLSNSSIFSKFSKTLEIGHFISAVKLNFWVSFHQKTFIRIPLKIFAWNKSQTKAQITKFVKYLSSSLISEIAFETEMFKDSKSIWHRQKLRNISMLV